MRRIAVLDEPAVGGSEVIKLEEARRERSAGLEGDCRLLMGYGGIRLGFRGRAIGRLATLLVAFSVILISYCLL